MRADSLELRRRIRDQRSQTVIPPGFLRRRSHIARFEHPSDPGADQRSHEEDQPSLGESPRECLAMDPSSQRAVAGVPVRGISVPPPSAPRLLPGWGKGRPIASRFETIVGGRHPKRVEAGGAGEGDLALTKTDSSHALTYPRPFPLVRKGQGRVSSPPPGPSVTARGSGSKSISTCRNGHSHRPPRRSRPFRPFRRSAAPLPRKWSVPGQLTRLSASDRLPHLPTHAVHQGDQGRHSTA